VEADFKDPVHDLRRQADARPWAASGDRPRQPVFRDKPAGLVVDYIGIGDDLKASLTAYSASDVDDVAIPVAIAVARLREKHEVVAEFFHGIDFRARHRLEPGQRANQFAQAVASVIGSIRCGSSSSTTCG
jgi:hypothetical protein